MPYYPPRSQYYFSYCAFVKWSTYINSLLMCILKIKYLKLLSVFYSNPVQYYFDVGEKCPTKKYEVVFKLIAPFKNTCTPFVEI